MAAATTGAPGATVGDMGYLITVISQGPLHRAAFRQRTPPSHARRVTTLVPLRHGTPNEGPSTPPAATAPPEWS